MLSNVIVQNAISIVIVIILLATFLLPKLWKYVLYGAFLITFGVLPIIKNREHISINPLSMPIFIYILLVIVILCGRELIVEGIKEQESAFRWISIIVGIVLIIITTIPTLYNFQAITFKLPEIPEIVLNGLYILSGIVLIIGSILTRE